MEMGLSDELSSRLITHRLVHTRVFGENEQQEIDFNEDPSEGGEGDEGEDGIEIGMQIHKGNKSSSHF